jgi:hypothetical protein
MEFDGRFPLSKSGPRKEAHAQIYSGSVDRVDELVNLRDVSIRRVQFAGLADKDVREFEIDSPVPRFVGVGEIGSSYQPAYSHRVEQIGLGAKTCLDVARAFPISQLGESHAKELIPRGKPLALSGHGVIAYASLELLPVDDIAALGEYYTAFVHNENETQIGDSPESNSNA